MEILFRGKRVDDKEWICGNLLRPNLIVTDWENDTGSRVFGLEAAAVYPDTIGIYTGFEDRDGRQIFEGDIITFLNGQYGVVRFGEHQSMCPVDEVLMPGVGFFVEADGCGDMPLGPTSQYAVVAGDIHNNPELVPWPSRFRFAPDARGPQDACGIRRAPRRVYMFAYAKRARRHGGPVKSGRCKED